jgi:hypothetical protein
MVDASPSGTTGEAVPVVLPATAVEMLPKGLAGIDAIDDTVVAVLPAVEVETGLTDTAGVPGAIWPVGAEQITTVPGVVGSVANGTGASVVSGAAGWAVAENGLGPLSGDVTIVPGVDGRPMAVLPMVETWAMLALQPDSRATTANN